MRPLVSLSCATYNHARYVKDTLDGFVMQQTKFPFEVVVHDDASTDGTQDIIREYERKYPKIFKVIYQKENQYSQGVNINKYISPKIKGKYIAICEGDDYWSHPNKLQLQADYMEAHEDCSCTFHSVIMLVNEKVFRISPYPQMYPLIESDVPTEAIIGNGGLMSTLSMVYRASLMKNLPAYYNIPSVGDYQLKFHLAVKGKIHYFTEPMAAYRFLRPGSWTVEYNNNIESKIQQNIKFSHYLREFQKDTKGKYTFPLNYQMQYYVNGILQSGQRERFKNLYAFLNTISQKQAQLDELKKSRPANDPEITKKQLELCNEFIMGVYPTLKE